MIASQAVDACQQRNDYEMTHKSLEQTTSWQFLNP